MKEQITHYQERYKSASPQELIKGFFDEFGDKLKVASSCGLEDQVLTHMAVEVSTQARIFVLDTGRLHQETYDVMALTAAKYGFNYEAYFPDTTAVENLLREKGPNSFYYSVENRKECCHIRKVEPLNRALSDAKVWITGIRRDQSVTRQDVQAIEWDDTHGLIKLNPIVDWSLDQVNAYLKENDVPVNSLHKQGFPSIGCSPCTRAIKEGEDIRAGRWWWENPESRECGLHVKD